MANLARHMRITGVTVTDADVNSRRAAVDDLRAAWSKSRTIDLILATAAHVAEALGGNGVPSAALGEEVQAAVQKHASAFLASESPLEVGIVAGTAAMSVVDGKPSGEWTVVEILATALWSALSFQPTLEQPKREHLRAEVLDATEARSRWAAETSRQRTEVSDFGELVVAAGEDKPTTNFRKATLATVTALKRNAALDREELDFLWWAQLHRSRVLGRSLSQLNEPVRLVAAGIEGAAYLRRLPCDVHRDVVLRTVQEDPEYNLPDLLDALGADGPELGKQQASAHVAKWPTLFPLLSSLAGDGTDMPGRLVRRRMSEWGARALLEAGFAKMLTHGHVTL